ncbi:MAG: hypothetical protein WDO70_03490 [Alphaproteobacteria bacterium]
MSRRAPLNALDLTPEESMLTGHDDLVVLQKRKLFQISANTRETYTTNAFLSDELKHDDFVFDGNVAARAGTRIAQRVDVFAETNLFTSQYAKNHQLSYNGYGGGVGAATSAGKFQFGLNYSAASVYDSHGFDKHSVTLHTVTLGVSRPYAVSANAAIVPQLAVERTMSDPSAYATWTQRAALLGVYGFTPELTGSVGTELAYRNYDDYFESVTGEAREDIGVRIAGAVRWQPVNYVQLAAEIGFGANGSTISSSRYTGFTASPGVSLNIRF